MRKFITRFFLFVILLAAIVFIVARYDNADKNWNSDHNVLKISHAAAFDSLDILFIGNSYCYSSIYNPLFDTIGLKTFNLGVASAGPKFYRMVLEDYLAAVKKRPDTVMLLITPMTFSRKADNWIDYPLHRYLIHPLSNEKLVVQYRAFSDYLLMLLNSARKGFNNILSRSELNEKELKKIFTYKGLYIDSTVTNDSVENSIKYAYTSLKKDVFNKQDALLLKDLADGLRRSGIAVIFFETPTHHLKNYFSSEFLKDYGIFRDEICRNYQLIKANEMAALYFRNIDHTNTQGAYQYTKYLISKLYQSPIAVGIKSIR
jgi:hypothetical protein